MAVTSNPIPFIDLRGKAAPDLLRAYPDRARDMVRASKRSWGIWSQAASFVALPLADRLSHRWLVKQNNPYLYEIETCAELLSLRGVYALNTCFEWGCTSGAWYNNGTVSLLRVLDWPFPDLGKHVLVALQRGAAGDFYNITWPGMVGVFNAMAPGRFSAAINQAPMRMHKLGFVGDWVRNRINMRHQRGMPPAHLLRLVCETATDYGKAKEMLRTTPLAIPAIFTLAGTKPGEGCIIERLENAAEVKLLADSGFVATANHFVSRLNQEGHGWRPRAIDSEGRYRSCKNINVHDLAQADFTWLRSPIVNSYTRLALLADAASGRLSVQGFEGITPVTPVLHKPGEDSYFQQAV